MKPKLRTSLNLEPPYFFGFVTRIYTTTPTPTPPTMPPTPTPTPPTTPILVLLPTGFLYGGIAKLSSQLAFGAAARLAVARGAQVRQFDLLLVSRSLV